MSYILDALRKADAQRERDPARGIHAQPVLLPVPASADGSRARVWWGVAVTAGLASLAAVAWQWMGTSTPAPAPAPAPVAVVLPPAPPPAAVVTTPALPAAQVLPAAPPPLPPAPAPAPPVQAAAKGAAKALPAAGSAPAPPPAADAPAAERIYAVADLPGDVQRELPKLAISGGVYSDNPAQRMLVVNGQVLNEGAQAAPGVVLEQIRVKTAVLKFRGFRYTLSY